jgi:2-polyprenyl-3-methyl-5-hydroxy-6-metoxy-1,4-benzoquinol methylase
LATGDREQSDAPGDRVGRSGPAVPGELGRFAFGENWSRFLRTLDDERIERAKRSLQSMLDVDRLEGKTFLDVGSGSGLFSLAARQLGAQVHSFDADAESVACTRRLKELFYPGDRQWAIEEASVLDPAYLQRLGPADVVYAWGVLHHTGQMWKALENVVALVAPGGRLFLALYNDQGRASRRWRRIKALYNRMPAALRPLLLWLCAVRLWGPTMVRDGVRLRPFHTWRTYEQQRGMSPWRDVVDWVGGYPFEVARPAEVLEFCQSRHLVLQKLKTCGRGRGCNEYVFQRSRASLSNS